MARLLDSNNTERSVGVHTQLGNTMLEIQGDLDIPATPPEKEDEFKRFSTQEGENIVRFGLLSISDDQKLATLFVGRKQRLLGQVQKLETPLGLLKFNKEQGTVEMQDIFQYKIIFKDRPLPIM